MAVSKDEALMLDLPFRGRWLVQNSPANRIPSHGTTLFASSYAIDFVPVDEQGRTAPVRLTTLLSAESPDRFPGFGRPILAPIDGQVIATHDVEEDHAAHRGLPSVVYAATQMRRASQGWLALAGNHVVIRTTGGSYVALCHLRKGSVLTRVGEGIQVGQPVASCGNSGNSTEPHLHLQAVDRWPPDAAAAVKVWFPGGIPMNGVVVNA